MEKRLFIAVMISIAFLFLWSAIAPKVFPELARPKKPAASTATTTTSQAAKSETPAAAQSPGATTPTLSQPVLPPASTEVERVREVSVDTPLFRAAFTNRGAQLTSFVLKNYREKNGSPVEIVRPRARTSSDYPFFLESRDSRWASDLNAKTWRVSDRTEKGNRVVTFETTDNQGHLVRKRFEFVSDYLFNFRVEAARPNADYRITVGPGIRELASIGAETQFAATGHGLIQEEGSLDVINREKAEDFETYPRPEIVGINDNYFLAVLKPKTSGAGSFRVSELSGAQKGEKRRELFAGLNAANGVVAGDAYFGPKEADLLDRHGLDNALQFGMFGAIARVLLFGLKYVFNFVHNYGWAIVILTVIIKLLLYPLQHKSIVSMKKMQAVQPKMNAIKEKYRKAKTDPDQRAKMNAEIMKLYQTEGISPMSGCLPILLQLPILWAFYNLLSQAIELRGAPFMLWITDLSIKDPYYITPILMTVTMFIQQAITPTTADPIQKKVFMAMPLVLGWVFKEFPSGLVLYWLVQNILTIIQQMIMNKYWKDHPESLKNP